ncbi:MAG: hypothetical protein CM1200mP10_06070 [Candidatus Neomarinimicrobiota bacterium]|nr:MAG: hypothetical protein CM1200mP10_06070 [Candidatus Neomarinimicrobiota bacterium]
MSFRESIVLSLSWGNAETQIAPSSRSDFSAPSATKGFSVKGCEESGGNHNWVIRAHDQHRDHPYHLNIHL